MKFGKIGKVFHSVGKKLSNASEIGKKIKETVRRAEDFGNKVVNKTVDVLKETGEGLKEGHELIKRIDNVTSKTLANPLVAGIPIVGPALVAGAQGLHGVRMAGGQGRKYINDLHKSLQ